MSARITARRRIAAVVLAVAMVGLAGCGGSDDPAPGAGADSGDDLASGIVEEGALAPEECFDVFAVAVGGDLDNVTLRPADWPEVFPQASVCNVSATVSDELQEIDYAVAASREEILGAFESALGEVAGYDVERTLSEERGYDLITGQTGEVGFQIDAKEAGGYTVTFTSGSP